MLHLHRAKESPPVRGVESDPYCPKPECAHNFHANDLHSSRQTCRINVSVSTTALGFAISPLSRLHHRDFLCSAVSFRIRGRFCRSRRSDFKCFFSPSETRARTRPLSDEYITISARAAALAYANPNTANVAWRRGKPAARRVRIRIYYDRSSDANRGRRHARIDADRGGGANDSRVPFVHEGGEADVSDIGRSGTNALSGSKREDARVKTPSPDDDGTIHGFAFRTIYRFRLEVAGLFCTVTAP